MLRYELNTYGVLNIVIEFGTCSNKHFTVGFGAFEGTCSNFDATDPKLRMSVQFSRLGFWRHTT